MRRELRQTISKKQSPLESSDPKKPSRRRTLLDRVIPGTSGRIEGIDVLRGFAVLLVMLSHANPLFGGSGILGVLMFFTLSGYLITGNLMKDISRTSRVRYGHFYRNRAIRLLPALIFMLLGLTVLAFMDNPTQDRKPILLSWIVGLTYTGNLPFFHGTLNIPHLWTLATEEQFYLLWPVILTLGVRFKRVGLTTTIFGASIFGTLLVCLFALHIPPMQAYFLPTSWGLALVVGAAARLWEHRISAVISPQRLRWLFPLAAASIGAAALSPNPSGWVASYLIGGPAVSALAVVLIYKLKTWPVLPSRWLQPLLALGTISYAAYLWNYPLAERLKLVGTSPWLEVASLPLTVLAAAISWWLVEKPANLLRRYLDRRAAIADVPRYPAVPLSTGEAPVRQGRIAITRTSSRLRGRRHVRLQADLDFRAVDETAS